MTDKELARRMFSATNALEQRLGRSVKLKELGQRVADAEDGRDEPYDASVVARWIKGEQAPRTRELWRALAKALGVDPGWLTYGTGSMTPLVVAEPSPPGYVSTETTPAMPMAPAESTPKAKKRPSGRGR